MQTVLCDSIQERHKYKAVGCATALITMYKSYDSDDSLNLTNQPLWGEQPMFVLYSDSFVLHGMEISEMLHRLDTFSRGANWRRRLGIDSMDRLTTYELAKHSTLAKYQSPVICVFCISLVKVLRAPRKGRTKKWSWHSALSSLFLVRPFARSETRAINIYVSIPIHSFPLAHGTSCTNL